MKKKTIGIAVCVLIALGIIGNMNKSDDPGKASAGTQQQEQQKESPEMQTYQKYVALPMGSSYDAVKSALGADGKLQHENDVAGIKTQSYEFKVGGAIINAMFQNGELTSKAMGSLAFFRQNGDKITLEQFNQVQTGMSYDQVKEIFKRDGALQSETSISGAENKLYSWINNDGSNAIITFGNGSVDSKTQANLK